MAATEALLTWSGLPPHIWNYVKEEESMATMKAQLRAMTMAMQAKDAAFDDLQRRLNAALAVAEQAQAREAALLRRAQKAEEAEEALASQMAEVEAEAFTRITQAQRLVDRHVELTRTNSELSMQVAELERRLKAALDKKAAMSQRCEVLEEELAGGKVRETAFQRRAEIAEEAEEALASQMAELEAEAFTRITESSKLLAARERNVLQDESCQTEPESIARSQVAAGLERQLAEAEEKLDAVNAKLREAEEKNRSLEMCVSQEGEKAVILKRTKQSNESEETVMSLSLEDLAGFVKLKLWNPSSLTLPIGKTACC